MVLSIVVFLITLAFIQECNGVELQLHLIKLGTKFVKQNLVCQNLQRDLTIFGDENVIYSKKFSVRRQAKKYPAQGGKFFSWGWESNPQPTVYKTVALPVELPQQLSLF